jgi:MFS superfamily sulfate permease-like transporter
VSLSRVSATAIRFWDTLREVPHTSLLTLAVSLAVIATLIVFGRWVRAVPGGLVAVVGAILASWTFNLESHGVSVVGPVPRGLPSIELPSGVGWSAVGPLALTSVSMFLVIIAQSAATSRAFAVRYRERLVENDDLVGLSLANVAAGFSSAFVVNGSPTKAEMADETGSRTQVAMLTMAATVAVVLLFLTAPLRYLPEAALSAVVFVIAVKLVDVRRLREVLRLRPEEFAIAAATAIVVVGLGVEQGVILGIVLSLLAHVRRHYEPHNTVITLDPRGRPVLVPAAPDARTEPGLVVYRFAVGLFYANTSRLTAEALAFADAPDPPRWLVLLADAMDDVDFTGGKTLVELAEQFAGRGIVFAVAEAQAAVLAELDAFGLTAAIGREHVYGTLEEAVAAFRAASPG